MVASTIVTGRTSGCYHIGDGESTTERARHEVVQRVRWAPSEVIRGQSFSVSVSTFGFIKIFAWRSWLLIFCSIVTLSLLSASIEKVLRRFAREAPHLFARRRVEKTYATLVARYAFNYATNLLLIGTDVIWIPIDDSLRVAFCAWLIAVLLLTQVFSAQVQATLLIRTEPPRVDDIQTVLRRRLIPFMWLGSVFPPMFKNSNDSNLMEVEQRSADLRAQVPENELFVPTRLIDVLSGRAVMVSDKTTLHSGVTRNCFSVPAKQRTGYYYFGSTALSNHYITFMMRPNIDPRLRRSFDDKIRQMFEGGLIGRWSEKTLGDMDDCHRDSGQKSGSVRPLNIEDMQGLFLMLLLAASLDAVLLIGEILWKRVRSCYIKKRQNKRQRNRDKINNNDRKRRKKQKKLRQNCLNNDVPCEAAFRAHRNVVKGYSVSKDYLPGLATHAIIQSPALFGAV